MTALDAPGTPSPGRPLHPSGDQQHEQPPEGQRGALHDANVATYRRRFGLCQVIGYDVYKFGGSTSLPTRRETLLHPQMIRAPSTARVAAIDFAHRQSRHLMLKDTKNYY
jgi:hypothetical protein